MKFKHQCFLMGALAISLASCSSESPWGSGSDSHEGAISLKVTPLNDVKASVPAVRAGSGELTPPPSEEFQIRLTKNDGSYTKTWSSTSEFAKEEEFAVGDYTLEAFFGDENSQGRVGAKGYETAYYYGTSPVTVREGQTSNVTLMASLANAVVVIEYTDAFKKYFPYFYTQLQSEGHGAIDLGDHSGEHTHVIPGNLGITISAELQNGKSIKLNPASFPTEARHMYKLRFNVYDGEVGQADKLGISFDENLTEEEVLIELTDEVVNTPAPIVTTSGFDSGQALEAQNSIEFPTQLNFNVVAKGGLKSAVLTVASEIADYATKQMPEYLKTGSVDFCNVDAPTKAEMEKDGLIIRGFGDKDSQMASVNLQHFVKNLPQGIHKFSFVVTDKNTSASDPVALQLNLFNVEMSMMPAGEAPFGEGYAEVLISYNGPDPTDPNNPQFSFMVENEHGSYTEARVLSKSQENPTRLFEKKTYRYRITLPIIDKDVFNVRANWGSVSSSHYELNTDVAFAYPDYEIVIDPMTRKMRLQVKSEDENVKTLYLHKLQVFVNGKRLNEDEEGTAPGKKFSRDDPTKLIALYDLEPSTTYNIKTSLSSDPNTTKFGSDQTVTTSPESPVPNGDFSVKQKGVYYENLSVGGDWALDGGLGIVYTYHTKCTFNYDEPAEGWASINQKTFYTGSKKHNSWFMVASTYLDGANAVIRTVGYNHNGVVPGVTKNGSIVKATKYNPTAPSRDDFIRVSGELFLGTYVFNGIETRTYGVPFDARPTSLVFKYRYEPQQEASRGSVEILVYDEAGNVISRRKKYLYANSVMTEERVVLNRYPFAIPAKKLTIRFLSSDLEEGDKIETKYPTGKELEEEDHTLPATPYEYKISTNSAHAMCIGSVLTISDLKFVYGERQNY